MSIDVHTLSGAYALDALTTEEAEEFEAHLQGCGACRTEVAEFREVVAAMGAQSWAASPRHLRAEVLGAAERAAQERPPARVEGTPVVDLATRRRRSPALMLAVAVAVVAAAVGGFIGVRTLGAQDAQTVPLAAPAQVVFNASDASQLAVKTSNGGTLHVAISQARKEMAVDARDLPRLDRQHVYQLWAVHNGITTSAAVLGADTTGAAMGLPGEDTQIAVTVEPGTGSKQPTSQPIATVDPSSI
ncbi:anti-sigma factor [Nocardioides marmoribigeumensis]|uniref:Regulator of SigK n=1 Tax=Nocardioides marmoribigeumensis TaxID=433649 RepID=A0ABU2C0M4_9ACTN|nr:anti-sigma factor [Nocardioides marmoribigeumensis]MDR7364159.1 anti-sigma-K factor RskA [Nocardioides marmoribigeumensis]